MRLEFHPAVDDVDLPVIYNFIFEDNPTAAEKVLEAIRATFSLLASQPRIGVNYRSVPHRSSQMRMLPVPDFRSYLVLYSVGSDFVRILYVVHASRNLPEVFAEDPRE